MKKSLLLTFVLSVALFGGLTTITENAGAAKWHKGTPRVLRGTYFTKKKPLRFRGRYFNYRLHISKSSLIFRESEYNKKGKWVDGGVNSGVFTATRYARIGRSLYQFHGYIDAWRTTKGSYFVKLYSGHRLRMNKKNSFKGLPYYYKH